METIVHTFEPVFDSRSSVLILGSLPSVRSRKNQFYYGHPQNRFWRVIAGLCGEPVPMTKAEKTQMLLRHRIALWDVVQQCDIEGSQDSSIKNVIPNDLTRITDAAPVKAVFCNGAKAYHLYQQFYGDSDLPCVCLPSTSPANAVWRDDRLAGYWNEAISNYLKG